MKKKYLIFILIIISFVTGYSCAVLSTDNHNEQPTLNVFGTYVQDFSTISINHDFTYQYTYPFTSGQFVKIDEQTYQFKNGDLDGFIAIFSEENIKLINTKDNTTPRRLTKISNSEAVLDNQNE